VTSGRVARAQAARPLVRRPAASPPPPRGPRVQVQPQTQVPAQTQVPESARPPGLVQARPLLWEPQLAAWVEPARRASLWFGQPERPPASASPAVARLLQTASRQPHLIRASRPQPAWARWPVARARATLQGPGSPQAPPARRPQWALPTGHPAVRLRSTTRTPQAACRRNLSPATPTTYTRCAGSGSSAKGGSWLGRNRVVPGEGSDED
jgi:hypothetical protein